MTADPRLVLVEWHDPQSYAVQGWKRQADVLATGLALVRSVGWVLRETAELLVIAAHMHGEDCDGDLTIPTACIVSIRDVGVKIDSGT